jgi:hypothetical protein
MLYSAVTHSCQMFASELKLILRLIHCYCADEKHKVIELRGAKNSVEQAKRSVDSILRHLHSSSTPDLVHIKQTGSHREYVQALMNSTDIIAPDHWKTYRGSLKDVGSAKPHLTPLDGGLLQAVISLVAGTWAADKAGQGRDAEGLRHSNIRVKKAWAVENVQLYRTYVILMKELYKQKSGRVPPVKGLVGEHEIYTVQKSNLSLLLKRCLKQCNSIFVC